MTRGFVLDSFAVMAWLKNSEPSAGKVNGILVSGMPIAMSAINVGEVLYTLQKRFSAQYADLFLARVPNMPVEIVTPDFDDIIEAAKIKARYPLAYADAFAAQLSMKRRFPLVTGDPELRAVSGLELVWLDPDLV
jgi:ribonuclease VapC